MRQSGHWISEVAQRPFRNGSLPKAASFYACSVFEFFFFATSSKAFRYLFLSYSPEIFDYRNRTVGIGKILGMTITLEVGEIERFKSAGHFASYCRAVESKRTSNEKGKGQNNRKCGNKYLSWAFVEAANFARRYDERCRRWYDRKASQTNTVIATKALACKLAKAAWHVMAHKTDYDRRRMLPEECGRAAVSQVKGLAQGPED